MLYCIGLRFLWSFQICILFYRFDQLKVCLGTYKLKASGQETGLESNLGSLTSIFKQVLAGLLNPSFNKSYMRSFIKKQKKNHIYLLLPLATRKEITARGKKDRTGYWPKAIRKQRRFKHTRGITHWKSNYILHSFSYWSNTNDLISGNWRALVQNRSVLSKYHNSFYVRLSERTLWVGFWNYSCLYFAQSKFIKSIAKSLQTLWLFYLSFMNDISKSNYRIVFLWWYMDRGH